MIGFSNYYRIKSRQRIALQGYTDSYCLLADTFGEAGFDYDYVEDTMTIFGKHAYKLSMPSIIENFSAYLEQEDKEISLTKEQFEKMLGDGMSGESYEIELKCRLKDGEWQHFRLFFSVIATDESYKRPVRMIGCLNNVEQNYQEKENLRYMGMYDKLTGLYNRTGMEWEMQERRKRGGNTDSDMLLVIDVDNFKSFNDKYGHQCGDDVLLFAGRQLQTTFRQNDVLCRWGGDEFLLYLIGAASHVELIERRCAALQKRMENYKYENRIIPITLSIGGASVGNRSFEEVFQDADKALYTVKENGRNGVCILRNEDRAE